MCVYAALSWADSSGPPSMRTREINQSQRASARVGFLTFSSSHLYSSSQCSLSVNISQPLSMFIAICTPHVAASQPAYACLFALHTRTGRNMHITSTSDTDSFTQLQQSACMETIADKRSPVRSRQDGMTALRCVVTVPPDAMHVEPEPSRSTCKSIGPLSCALP
jgi:hypothetical protein